MCLWSCVWWNGIFECCQSAEECTWVIIWGMSLLYKDQCRAWILPAFIYHSCCRSFNFWVSSYLNEKFDLLCQNSYLEVFSAWHHISCFEYLLCFTCGVHVRITFCWNCHLFVWFGLVWFCTSSVLKFVLTVSLIIARVCTCYNSCGSFTWTQLPSKLNQRKRRRKISSHHH